MPSKGDSIFRPLSITVISWFIISSSVAGFFLTIGNFNKAIGQRNFFWVCFYIIAPGVAMLSGFFMLQGKNWARFLYVIWSFFISMVPHLLLRELKAGVIVLIMIYVFLFLPNANRYFSRKEESSLL